MSSIKKALFFIGTLIGLSFAATSVIPDLNSALIVDDFDDIYGDNANQTTIGAVKGWAQYGRTYTGNYGYWYIYTDVGYAWVIAGVSTHDTINKDNTKQLIDGKLLHFSFKTKPDSVAKPYPSAEVSCNFFGPNDSANLTNMTAISFRAKGSGTVRVSIMSQNVKPDWGYLGDTVKLSSAWTNVSIPIAKLKPAPYSASEGKVTWDQSKTSAFGFQIKTQDSKNAEVYIDSILFDGMKYSDVMQKVGVKPSFSVPRAYSNSAISVNNGAIAYTVAQPQNIDIALFNANGKMVRTVYTGFAAVGTHSVALPQMVAGTYFVRMNNDVNSQKVTIVK